MLCCPAGFSGRVLAPPIGSVRWTDWFPFPAYPSPVLTRRLHHAPHYCGGCGFPADGDRQSACGDLRHDEVYGRRCAVRCMKCVIAVGHRLATRHNIAAHASSTPRAMRSGLNGKNCGAPKKRSTAARTPVPATINTTRSMRTMWSGPPGVRAIWQEGELYERNPYVVFYRKSNCSIVASGFQKSWLRFEAHYPITPLIADYAEGCGRVDLAAEPDWRSC